MVINYHYFSIFFLQSLLRTLQRLFLFVILRMNKFLIAVSGLLLLLTSCNPNNKQDEILSDKKITLSVFPVTEFLKGQLKEVEKSPVTPLKTVILNGHVDSTWISRDSVRVFAAPFLTPIIDSASLSAYFNGDSFLDQTINSITLSYDANNKLPENISLRGMDIYVDPKENTITKVYLLKETNVDSINTKIQLTWKTNEWCSIVTITQIDGKDPVIKEEKMAWAFN